ncbi:hypothetical protein DPMN_140179 [Dreissena polymorpha]|uniref:Uncharacterized protein n=1 Tax=Dreissena polymorpha TaxID=45954 RepID=A0A9D4G746_DREPO|nr:hypothetical protein DPMN_140179 [Dreissena polymorpha]
MAPHRDRRSNTGESCNITDMAPHRDRRSNTGESCNITQTWHHTGIGDQILASPIKYWREIKYWRVLKYNTDMTPHGDRRSNTGESCNITQTWHHTGIGDQILENQILENQILTWHHTGIGDQILEILQYNTDMAPHRDRRSNTGESCNITQT